VERVERTLVFLKPDVLLMLDRVKLKAAAVPVQLRFQVFNDDEGGKCVANGATFEIARPTATLHAKVAALGAEPVAKTGRHEISESEGIFPFVQVTSPAALEHTVLTVSTAAPKGAAHGDLAITHAGGEWKVTGTHGNVRVNATLSVTKDGRVVVNV
jgi:hypothetical protein